MSDPHPEGRPPRFPSRKRRSANTQQHPQVLLFHGFTHDSLDTPGGGAGTLKTSLKCDGLPRLVTSLLLCVLTSILQYTANFAEELSWTSASPPPTPLSPI